MRARGFLISIILFFGGFYFMYTGIMKMNVNTTPVECSIADLETKGLSNFSKYDYFKISGGQTIGIAYFVKDVKSGNIDEVVYPIFSKGYLDTLENQYVASSDYAKNGADGFIDWATKGHLQPKVLVKSVLVNITRNELKKKMDSLDDKLIAGTRMTKLENISDLIKDEIKKDGIDINNAVIVAEGVSAADSKDKGWSELTLGILLVGVIGIYYILRFRGLRKPKPVS